MFKSLTVFKFEAEADSTISSLVNDPEFIADFLANNECPELDKFDVKRVGFAPIHVDVIEQATDIIKNRVTFLPLTQVICKRAIDNAAVKCEVERKAKAIEKAELRKVGRKEREELKNEVLFNLIPKAPIKEKQVFGFVVSTGYILVGATGKSAEEYTSHLREALGSLKCVPAYTDEAEQITPTVLELLDRKYLEMDDTDFIYEPNGSFMFELGSERVDIRNCNEATYTHELHDRLKKGRVNWCGFESDDGNIEFRLTSNFELKSIKLDVQPELSDEDARLSAAWYRFYLNFFMSTMERLASEVRAWATVESDAE